MTMNKQEVADKAFSLAKSYEKKSGGCSQCSLAGIFDALGVEDTAIFKAATGLADGVGLTGDGHCGALSGGVLAIGYFFGRDKENFDDITKLVPANILAKKLHARFTEKYGTCRCHDLQTSFFGRFFNLYDPEDMKAGMEAGMLERCSTLAGEVAQMAVEIILDAQEKAART
ncbi:C-GCAxxG-C-C family protein [Desulfatibacillum aliphaticivorans]|uniref:C-GCAxxG-C-C family protein n=1 Tax=Desulfatibacillum aliphaticivorans TaxID=218208 RepID=UPI0004065F02|nr:C-GCAxxG-C-C family protein [Desulfatibacillum aliphaticivorans]